MNTMKNPGEYIPDTCQVSIERHPLEPFLPPKARLLMLGSFPPPRTRWCMDFFYPNPQNDMWRIMGLVFFGEAGYFVNAETRKFNYKAIVEFCIQQGIAIYDTAKAVRRLRGNASDAYLEVVEPTDIAELLSALPLCTDICCTGQKATEVLCAALHCVKPAVGAFAWGNIAGRNVRLWRMPSSSRAYPMSLVKKANVYKSMIDRVFADV